MVRGNDMIHRSQGVALIAVLWIVAAMAIAVTGMTHAVRNEIRTAAAARSSIESEALGEAAIALALQKMLAQRPFKPWARMDVEYRGLTMAVEVASLNGWIDINTAPDALLASLYAVAGGLPAQAASALAAANKASGLCSGLFSGPRIRVSYPKIVRVRKSMMGWNTGVSRESSRMRRNSEKSVSCRMAMSLVSR